MTEIPEARLREDEILREQFDLQKPEDATERERDLARALLDCRASLLEVQTNNENLRKSRADVRSKLLAAERERDDALMDQAMLTQYRHWHAEQKARAEKAERDRDALRERAEQAENALRLDGEEARKTIARLREALEKRDALMDRLFDKYAARFMEEEYRALLTDEPEEVSDVE